MGVIDKIKKFITGIGTAKDVFFVLWGVRDDYLVLKAEFPGLDDSAALQGWVLRAVKRGNHYAELTDNTVDDRVIEVVEALCASQQGWEFLYWLIVRNLKHLLPDESSEEIVFGCVDLIQQIPDLGDSVGLTLVGESLDKYKEDRAKLQAGDLDKAEFHTRYGETLGFSDQLSPKAVFTAMGNAIESADLKAIDPITILQAIALITSIFNMVKPQIESWWNKRKEQKEDELAFAESTRVAGL